MIFQPIFDVLPTHFVHPLSCRKQLKTATPIDISTFVAVFTNTFCPITLKSTGELTYHRHGNFGVISIKNYCYYQDVNTLDNKPPTDLQQTSNKPLTTIEERNKKKKEIREENKTPVNGRGGYPTDIIDQYDFSEELRAKIDEWLEYKKERRESYKSTGLTALLRKISQKSSEYGENPVMALMDECMANGWRGIIWDKLRTEKEDDNGGKQDDDDWDKYLKGGLTV